MLKKIIVISLALVSLFGAVPVSAQGSADSQLPELNPFCWRRADCERMLRQFGTDSSADSFVTSGVAPCEGGEPGSPQEWGRCLPAGKSVTEISFGGQNRFSHIGEFILLMYKYLVTIASIVAVIMIILAGVQWVTSGGNSERISSAKKRIGGAIIGLFIAYMSYFILNTINPALVNLRLPQVWLIRPSELIPQFCSDINGADDGMTFMQAATQSEQAKKVSLEESLAKAKARPSDGYTWTNPSTNLVFYCGSRFFAEGGGQSTCRGRFCESGEPGEVKACYNTSGKANGKFECGDVRVSGQISYTALAKKCGGFFELAAKKIASNAIDVFGEWGCPPVSDMGLVLVCEDPEELQFPPGDPFYEVALSGIGGIVKNLPKRSEKIDIGKPEDYNNKEGHYIIRESSALIRSRTDEMCGKGRTKGFVIRVELMKENLGWGNVDKGYGHFAGRHGEDLGDRKFWTYAHRIRKDILFSVDEIVEGVTVNLDASDFSPAAEVSRYEKYLE